MRSGLCFVFVVLTFISGLNSQTTVEEADWRLLTPSWGELSVEVPLEMDVINVRFLNEFIEVKYSGRVGDTFLFIFADVVEKGNGHQGVLQALFHYSNRRVMSIPSRKIEFISFEGPDEYFHNIALTRTGKWIYAFHTASPDANDPIVRRFLRSLRVNQRSITGIKSLEDDGTAVIADTKTDKGSGSDPGVGGSAGRPTAQPGSSPLVITAQPRPSYTNIARSYGITGGVELSVTFDHDGRISAVSPIRKLPFGLTENAIRAAKEIRFTPAERDGKPVSVTRNVIYTFTIY